MGAVLLKDACENGVYTHPDSLVSSPKMVANVHERTSLDGWHKRLGHPSQKIVQHLVNSFSLPKKKKTKSKCLIFVSLVQSIKLISNHFVQLVFKVMHHLI